MSSKQFLSDPAFTKLTGKQLELYRENKVEQILDSEEGRKEAALEFVIALEFSMHPTWYKTPSGKEWLSNLKETDIKAWRHAQRAIVYHKNWRSKPQ